jgi:Winged helix-turn helix
MVASRGFHKFGLVMGILGFQGAWEIWFHGACRLRLVSGIDPLAQGSCLRSRRAPLIRLSREEKQQLQRIATAHSSPQARAFRSRIILRCGQGDRPTHEEVAQECDCDPGTVGKGRRRFAAQRLDGLADLPRSGAPRAFSPGRPA